MYDALDKAIRDTSARVNSNWRQASIKKPTHFSIFLAVWKKNARSIRELSREITTLPQIWNLREGLKEFHQRPAHRLRFFMLHPMRGVL